MASTNAPTELNSKLRIVYILGSALNDKERLSGKKDLDGIKNTLQSSGYPYKVYDGYNNKISISNIKAELKDKTDEQTIIYLNAHGTLSNIDLIDRSGTPHHYISLSLHSHIQSARAFYRLSGPYDSACQESTLMNLFSIKCLIEVVNYFFTSNIPSQTNKPSHIELFSCHSGGAAKDITNMPFGSSVVTHSSADNKALMPLNDEELKASIKELHHNAFVNYVITILISAEQENSLSIATFSGIKTFQVKLPPHVCSTTDIASWQRNKLVELKAFYKAIVTQGVPGETIDQIKAAIEFIEQSKEVEVVQTKYIDRVQELVLLDSAFKNDVDQIKCLLDFMSPNVKTNTLDLTPLYIASQYCHTEAVKLLIASNVSINTTSDKGATLLYIASQNGCTEVAKLLITANANLNIMTDEGTTSLYTAADNGHTEIVKLHITAQADLNMTGSSGFTPLHIASYNGNTEIARLFIDAHADLNATTASGSTALFMAAWKGKYEIVKTLIAAHANLDATTGDGATALCVAAEAGHTEIVKLLIAAQADLDAATDDCVTPLYIASQHGHIEIVKLLIAAQANLNVATNANETALYVAAEVGKYEVVKALTDAGADVNYSPSTNKTALYAAACISKSSDIINWLLTHGAIKDEASEICITQMSGKLSEHSEL